ncbi:hypothetical protein Hanom_Chr01g00049801 [Helianthus anomalus]
MNHAGEEFVRLSSTKSVASSEHGLTSPGCDSAGALCDLGIDPGGQKVKRVSKKKPATTAGGHKMKKVKATTTISDAVS